eukprot:10988189-Prorocentrum_lima.AAC.1
MVSSRLVPVDPARAANRCVARVCVGCRDVCPDLVCDRPHRRFRQAVASAAVGRRLFLVNQDPF